ncbi:MAG: hypothetical protein ACJATT_004609, partial [Myxococcota bacterium]
KCGGQPDDLVSSVGVTVFGRAQRMVLGVRALAMLLQQLHRLRRDDGLAITLGSAQFLPGLRLHAREVPAISFRAFVQAERDTSLRLENPASSSGRLLRLVQLLGAGVAVLAWRVALGRTQVPLIAVFAEVGHHVLTVAVHDVVDAVFGGGEVVVPAPRLSASGDTGRIFRGVHRMILQDQGEMRV